MADEEQVVSIRVIKGVNLNVNSRLLDSGIWLQTQNMWSRLLGVLEPRPGSTLISKTLLNMTTFPNSGYNPSGNRGVVEPALTSGQKVPGRGFAPPYVYSGARATGFNGVASSTLTIVKQAVQEIAHVPAPVYARNGAAAYPGHGAQVTAGTEINVTSTAAGQQGQIWSGSNGTTHASNTPTWPDNPAIGATVTDNTVTWTFKGNNQPNSMRIEALTRFTFPFSGLTYWLGAMASHLNDFLFYLNSSNQMVPIPGNNSTAGTLTPTVNSHDGKWQFIGVLQGFQVNGVSDDAAFQALFVNGVDSPLGVAPVMTTDAQGNQVINTTTPFQVQSLAFMDANGGNNIGSGFNYVGQTCGCLYGNQVVWGGGSLVPLPGVAGNITRLDNCLLFSDPPNPVVVGGASSSTLANTLAGTLAGSGIANTLYTLQVGSDPSEPVTAVSGSPALTDGFGIQGQLIAWTQFKTLIYNGPVPSSGNPIPPGFGLASAADVGCSSPKTVVRTSYGTVFLASDGNVMLVGLDNKVKVISRALEPMLGQATQQFLSMCSAYYIKGFYHLFFPLSTNGGAPMQEWVADLRIMSFWSKESGLQSTEGMYSMPLDSGVHWHGPWLGRWVNCIGIARDPQSGWLVYAGLSHLPAIIQLEPHAFVDPNEVPTTFTDVSMYDLTTLVTPTYAFITGPNDLGDAHLDKVITAFLLGVGCQNTVSVTATLSVHSDIAGTQALAFTKTKTVNPPTNVLTGAAGGFQLGTSVLSDVNNFALPAWQPPSVMRGRAFQLSAQIVPTTPCYFRITDMEFRVRPVIRRPTDV